MIHSTRSTKKKNRRNIRLKLLILIKMEAVMTVTKMIAEIKKMSQHSMEIVLQLKSLE